MKSLVIASSIVSSVVTVMSLGLASSAFAHGVSDAVSDSSKQVWDSTSTGFTNFSDGMSGKSYTEEEVAADHQKPTAYQVGYFSHDVSTGIITVGLEKGKSSAKGASTVIESSFKGLAALGTKVGSKVWLVSKAVGASTLTLIMESGQVGVNASHSRWKESSKVLVAIPGKTAKSLFTTQQPSFVQE